MWYFTWIIGIGAALAAGIINVMWLESNQDFVFDEPSTLRDDARS